MNHAFKSCQEEGLLYFVHWVYQNAMDQLVLYLFAVVGRFYVLHCERNVPERRLQNHRVRLKTSSYHTYIENRERETMESK